MTFSQRKRVDRETRHRVSGLDDAARARTGAEEPIVRAPLGNGAGVFAPNIKLGLFGPRAGWDLVEQGTQIDHS